jgi:hypothetical protein
MPCDTKRLPNQSLTERKVEITKAVDKLAAALAAGKVKPVVGAKGGIAFPGWTEGQVSRVTDNCGYRKIMSSGSALAKLAIERAEMMAGRKVDRQAVAQGLHTHGDGVWHNHKG